MAKSTLSPVERLGLATPLVAAALFCYFTATGQLDIVEHPLIVAAVAFAALAATGTIFGAMGMVVASVCATLIALSVDLPYRLDQTGLPIALQAPAVAGWIALGAMSGRYLLTGYQRRRQMKLGGHLENLKKRLRRLEQLQSAGGVAEVIGATCARWQNQLDELAESSAELLTHMRSDDTAKATAERFAKRLLAFRTSVETQRVFAGHRELKAENEARLEDAVKLALEWCTPETEGSGVEIEVNVDDGGPPCSFDVELLATAIAELLRNAIQASARGGKVTISAYSDFRGQRALIEVIDRGSALNSDLLKHIFKPFFTTRRGQLGLGLAAVKEIMRKLGGSVAVARNDMRGMTFKMRFPMRRAELEAPAAEAIEADLDGEGSLITVEDFDSEEENTESAERAVSAAGEPDTEATEDKAATKAESLLDSDDGQRPLKDRPLNLEEAKRVLRELSS